MFGNKLVYTQSPGGIRRGLIWQSSNVKEREYKWVDRYTIGSTTIDGEDYTLAMGYTFPGVLAGDDFQIPLYETSPIQFAGILPKPFREWTYGQQNDFYFFNYTIQPIFDHITLRTTFGSLYPNATEALYRSAEHQYMRNSEHVMTRTIDSNKSLYRNLIKPVYSAFWVKRGSTITLPDNEYMPAGTYTTDSTFFSRGYIDYPGYITDPPAESYTKWLAMSEIERRYTACPELYKYILTDKTTKIKVPRKALVTDRTDAWTLYQPYELSGGVATLNSRFSMDAESMIGHVDGETHSYQPRWNTRALWQQTYDSDEQQYVDNYYVMFPTSSSAQSMAQSRIYASGGTVYARLMPIIPERSSGSSISAFAPVWYGPVIAFGNYLNINNSIGMTDFYIDNAYGLTGNGHLVMVLNGYECEYTSLNEVDMT